MQHLFNVARRRFDTATCKDVGRNYSFVAIDLILYIISELIHRDEFDEILPEIVKLGNILGLPSLPTIVA